MKSIFKTIQISAFWFSFIFFFFFFYVIVKTKIIFSLNIITLFEVKMTVTLFPGVTIILTVMIWFLTKLIKRVSISVCINNV